MKNPTVKNRVVSALAITSPVHQVWIGLEKRGPWGCHVESDDNPQAAATCSVDDVMRRPSPQMGMRIQAATILGFGSPHLCNHAAKRWRILLKLFHFPVCKAKLSPNLSSYYTHLDLAATRVDCHVYLPNPNRAARKVDSHFWQSRNLIETSEEYHKWIILWMCRWCGRFWRLWRRLTGGGHACTVRFSGGWRV